MKLDVEMQIKLLCKLKTKFVNKFLTSWKRKVSKYG